jgi:release factor glutamine methyltransferase
MAQTEEVWTVGRLLAWTTDFLRQRGAESPRLDAEVLLAHALGCPRIQLYTTFDEQPPEAARQKFREFVRERAAGMPVAYLVGRREFYSLSFRVTPDVLIPRPETEFLLIRLLDLAKQQAAGSSAPLRIADVGTGSGILAVCAAKNIAGSAVTAVDISSAALAVARENAQEHGVADQIEFVESDLFARLPEDRKFDFIVSNPPYVKSSEMDELMVDVRKFEPRMALDAGEQGTDVIERLVPQAAERLAPGGWLLMEIGPAIEAEVRRLVTSQGQFEISPSIKDLAGHVRVIQARRC